MNENIKRLWNKAAEQQGCMDTNDWDAHVKFLNDFAQEIIQDFLSICEAERDGYLKLRKSSFDFEDKNIYAEGESACDRIRIMTKRHFGVK